LSQPTPSAATLTSHVLQSSLHAAMHAAVTTLLKLDTKLIVCG
jgi:hypothetical protein